ncbi:RDD family protein [Cytophaga aurantiaca]|uniref:RDD family protein n=1 Tax=Cytophaga aurantiaca TaxID=29530 RepID=UPI00039D3B53|nr:RDD family protein [Cytophaga aurantiaca]
MEEAIQNKEINPDVNIIQYPSLTDRIKSSMIDVIFILFLMSCIAVAMDNFIDVPDGLRAGLFIFLFFVYEPLAHTFGFTLGNYLMGIRVRKLSAPQEKINIAQAYLRFSVKTLLGWVSFFTINSNKKRRAIHDIVSGTVTIYA